MKEQMNDILRRGYEKSAEALGNLLVEKIELKSFNASLQGPLPFLESIHYKEGACILVTDIIGEAKGKSFLVLDAMECEFITEALLRSLKNFDKKDYFMDIFLKEVDNVLAATMITELSNFFDLKIYGDVPAIYKPEAKSKDWMSNELGKGKYQSGIVSMAQFSFEKEPKLSLSMAWLLEEKFLNLLKGKNLQDV